MKIIYRKASWTVFQLEVLIGEFLSVNTFAASSVVVGKISALAHEAWNDPMEC